MIFLFTDFGRRASYMGQMQAVVGRRAPSVPVITLTADAPAFAPRLAAYLLAAEARIAMPGDVVVAVVDPGVGTARRALALLADGVWYVGPDNGLLSVVARRAHERLDFEIVWRPAAMSASFHGRDLFAPVAAALAQGRYDALAPATASALGHDWPEECDVVVCVDDYGNAMTGRRAASLVPRATLAVPGRCESLPRARTFADDVTGTGFWYENAMGLAEISVREGSAAARFGLAVGTPVQPRPLPTV